MGGGGQPEGSVEPGLRNKAVWLLKAKRLRAGEVGGVSGRMGGLGDSPLLSTH